MTDRGDKQEPQGDREKRLPLPGRLRRAIARSKPFRQRMPESLKRVGRRLFGNEAYYRELWRAQNRFADVEEVSTYAPRVNIRLGIITGFTYCHHNFLGACRSLGVPYRLVDISRDDWIQTVRAADCDGFLAHIPSNLSIWKQMYDDRIRILAEELGRPVFPSMKELWLYESKRRSHYWMVANDVPHPRTWVFYSCDEALDFIRRAELPLVTKTDLGAGSSGVRVFRERSSLAAFVKRTFSRGITRQVGIWTETHFGYILLQEYLPNAKEWRIERLGDSFFGHQKMRKGEFHSGTGEVGWYDPPQRLLSFAREVTEKGGFRSMDVDVFETEDGRYLVNELQALFGTLLDYQMLVDGKPGRYLYDDSSAGWRFEEGVFCQNGCGNLRVEAFLKQLGIACPAWSHEPDAHVREQIAASSAGQQFH